MIGRFFGAFGGAKSSDRPPLVVASPSRTRCCARSRRLVYATSAPIDFNSPDSDPVDLVFTLLWPRSEARTFLPALSRLFRMVRAPLIREGLRLAQSPGGDGDFDERGKAGQRYPMADQCHALGGAKVNSEERKMKKHIQNSQKPSIVIGETDHQRLNKLALAAADRLPEVSDGLLIELERALVVADTSAPRNVVRMGSTVEYEADTGDGRTVTLVFPKDADISEGRISVLTPIGTALLGLSAGQTMGWSGRDDRRHKLTVLAVTQQHRPESEGLRSSETSRLLA
ncbi:transcription elongation GreA/GreB family factor [Sinorhizobium fredii]